MAPALGRLSGAVGSLLVTVGTATEPRPLPSISAAERAIDSCPSFFWEQPRIMFMHIGGTGDETALATAVGKVFAKIEETSGGRGETPSVQLDPAQSALDASRIDAALGAKGKIDRGIYKVEIGRTFAWTACRPATRWA